MFEETCCKMSTKVEEEVCIYSVFNENILKAKKNKFGNK